MEAPTWPPPSHSGLGGPGLGTFTHRSRPAVSRRPSLHPAKSRRSLGTPEFRVPPFSGQTPAPPRPPRPARRTSGGLAGSRRWSDLTFSSRRRPHGESRPRPPGAGCEPSGWGTRGLWPNDLQNLGLHPGPRRREQSRPCLTHGWWNRDPWTVHMATPAPARDQELAKAQELPQRAGHPVGPH